MSAMSPNRTILFLGVVALAGCAAPGLFADDTVGEKFRKVLADIDARCRQDKMGPYLDRSDPAYRRKVGVTSCDILKLEPRDWRTEKMVKTEGQHYPVPERWLATPEGRFAHSIKLPASIDLVAEDFSHSDGARLFQRLCARYAGEHVLRRVANVEGLLQGRPFQPYPGEYRGLVFWTREKGDIGNAPQGGFVQPPMGKFNFLEVWRSIKLSEAPQLVRFERGPVSASTRTDSIHVGDGKFASVPYVVVERAISETRARFAYTWRGIWPGRGVEHGIEGYELIVYQVEPFQVMAVMRDFLRHGPYPGQHDARLTTAEFCSSRTPTNSPTDFIRSVLSPKPH